MSLLQIADPRCRERQNWDRAGTERRLSIRFANDSPARSATSARAAPISSELRFSRENSAARAIFSSLLILAHPCVSSRSPQPYWLMKGINRKKSARNMHVPNCAFSNQAGNYENNTGIENDEADFHWQMDAKGFVFASGKTLSTHGVAPSSPRGLPAGAYQKSSQSRIRRLSRPDCDGIESHCCRVFVDSTGKDHHRSTRRHVRLGQTIPQGLER